MKIKKRFYGIRFLGGNRSCTMGSPNKKTGRVSTACDIVSSTSKKTIENWVKNEKLTAPTGCGGGERDFLFSKEVNFHLRGLTLKKRAEYFDFTNDLDQGK